MNNREKKLFRQREGLCYLYEDCRIASIELRVRIQSSESLFSFSENYFGVQGDLEPSIIIPYINNMLYKKHLLEIEYIRESSNLNYLTGKIEELWQK